MSYININGYEFSDSKGYLWLRSKDHNNENIDGFFESLGITREIFIDKFNAHSYNVFPEYDEEITSEVIEYLQSLVSNSNETTHYEIY